MPVQDTDRPIAILVAVEEELRALLKRMPPAVVDSAGGIRIYEGALGDKAVVLAKSGIGAERSGWTAMNLIRQASPSALIVAGFCGGLSAAPGDIVVADRVFDESGNRYDPYIPDTRLFDIACAIAVPGISVRVGGLVTLDRIARTPREKKAACNDARRAIALDMESAGAAAAAVDAGIPWLVVRAVTDGPLDTMPLDFSQYVDADGDLNHARIALATVVRPWMVPAMVRLGNRSARAAGHLASYVEAYVRSLNHDSWDYGITRILS